MHVLRTAYQLCSTDGEKNIYSARSGNTCDALLEVTESVCLSRNCYFRLLEIRKKHCSDTHMSSVQLFVFLTTVWGEGCKKSTSAFPTCICNFAWRIESSSNTHSLALSLSLSLSLSHTQTHTHTHTHT